MKKSIISTVLIFAFIFFLYSKTSDHQRLSVEKTDFLSVMPGISTSFIEFSDSSTPSVFLTETFSFYILYRNRFSFSGFLPIYTMFNTDIKNQYLTTFALGDPELSIGYSFRVTDWKCGVDAFWLFPLGIWNDHEVTEKKISSGLGYNLLELDFSGIYYIDPVALHFAFIIQASLPRKEQFGVRSQLLSNGIKASLTYAINSNIAFVTGFSSSVVSTHFFEEKTIRPTKQWKLDASMSLIISNEKKSGGCKYSKNLLDNFETGAITLFYARSFNF